MTSQRHLFHFGGSSLSTALSVDFAIFAMTRVTNVDNKIVFFFRWATTNKMGQRNGTIIFHHTIKTSRKSGDVFFPAIGIFGRLWLCNSDGRWKMDSSLTHFSQCNFIEYEFSLFFLFTSNFPLFKISFYDRFCGFSTNSEESDCKWAWKADWRQFAYHF